jgi:hypothetical protein
MLILIHNINFKNSKLQNFWKAPHTSPGPPLHLPWGGEPYSLRTPGLMSKLK